MSVLRHQPIKAFYLIFELLATCFVRIPIWTLTAIPRSWRPRRSWSIKRTLLINLARHLFTTVGKTGPFRKIPNHHAITPSVEGQGVWIEPVPNLITGELQIWADVAKVSAVRIPGYWLSKKGEKIEAGAPPMPAEKVIYALHGGAYCRLSAHPSDPTTAIARDLLKGIDTVHRVFSVEYRLSSGKPWPEENPFPAALIDALAGYNYLVNVVGFSPSDVIIEGDSAGGNLALALTRYLVEYRNSSVKLPTPPSALILLSPWTDLGVSHHDHPKASFFANQKSDYLGFRKTPGYGYTVEAFVGPHGAGAAELNRYISPGSKNPAMKVSFEGFPHTFINAGGAEMLYDSIVTLRDRMVKDMGKDKVEFYDAPDAVHDYICLTSHEPERTQTLQAIAKWVASL
ncbi:alpha/beta-hydrolase [Dendrothele bispora CBS 962.96]|uniref:Alpha/beta-hydrolase n=1 Tax=Dendrothele bispora (strain CBS 962.96) TaxID=1314807 RepID=A0A4S8MI03_DENBC|nr:alpha/beta-hydrolase [Dendrothele bispora CBS 962.96]